VEATDDLCEPVRDRKDPHGPALMFTVEAVASFVAAVKAAEF